MKCRKRGRKSGWIRRKKRLLIYARDDFKCVYCDRQFTRSDLTLDHVRARSNGGHNHHTNLVTACRSCNSSKQNKTIREWMELTYPEVSAHLMTKVLRRRVRNAQRRKLP